MFKGHFFLCNTLRYMYSHILNLKCHYTFWETYFIPLLSINKSENMHKLDIETQMTFDFNFLHNSCKWESYSKMKILGIIPNSDRHLAT